MSAMLMEIKTALRFVRAQFYPPDGNKAAVMFWKPVWKILSSLVQSAQLLPNLQKAPIV